MNKKYLKEFTTNLTNRANINYSNSIIFNYYLLQRIIFYEKINIKQRVRFFCVVRGRNNILFTELYD